MKKRLIAIAVLMLAATLRLATADSVTPLIGAGATSFSANVTVAGTATVGSLVATTATIGTLSTTNIVARSITSTFTLPTEEASQRFAYLPVTSTAWTTVTTISELSATSFTSGGQNQMIVVDGVHYMVFEYGIDTDGYWSIGLAYSTSLTGPWTVIAPLISRSNLAGYADRYGVADPTILYIPWATHPWQMWFEMFEAAISSGVQSIGHAYADSPTGPWTKQTGADGKPTRVLSQGANYMDYDYSAGSTQLHHPEAVLYGNCVRLLYGVQGYGHTTWDAQLAIANDSLGLGYSFDKWGPVTIDETLSTASANRLQNPFVYQGVMYAVLGGTVSTTNGPWVSSVDGGKSWQEIGPSTNAAWPSMKFHSFWFEDNDLYGVAFPIATQGSSIYKLDLDAAVTAPGNLITTSTATRLPLTQNNYLDYRLRGTPVIERTDEGLNLGKLDSLYMPSGDGGLGNLVFYMPFAEGTGTIAYDRSPYASDGTITKGTGGWTTAGAVGNAYTFDGAATYVDCGNSSATAIGTSSATIEFWVKMTSTDATERIMERRGGTRWWGIYKATGGTFTASFNSDSKTVSHTNTKTLNDGAWHHCALVRNAGVSFQWYVDGMLDVASSVDTTTNVANTANLRIGLNYAGSGVAFFTGSLDEVRIYNRALSGAEVRLHYLRSLRTFTSVASSSAGAAVVYGTRALAISNATTNVALRLTASGGTNNRALYIDAGDAYLGTTATIANALKMTPSMAFNAAKQIPAAGIDLVPQLQHDAGGPRGLTVVGASGSSSSLGKDAFINRDIYLGPYAASTARKIYAKGATSTTLALAFGNNNIGTSNALSAAGMVYVGNGASGKGIDVLTSGTTGAVDRGINFRNSKLNPGVDFLLDFSTTDFWKYSITGGYGTLSANIVSAPSNLNSPKLSTGVNALDFQSYLTGNGAYRFFNVNGIANVSVNGTSSAITLGTPYASSAIPSTPAAGSLSLFTRRVAGSGGPAVTAALIYSDATSASLPRLTGRLAFTGETSKTITLPTGVRAAKCSYSITPHGTTAVSGQPYILDTGKREQFAIVFPVGPTMTVSYQVYTP